MINWILERGSDVRKLGMTNFKATGIEIVTQEESEQLCSPLEWGGCSVPCRFICCGKRGSGYLPC